MLFLLALIGLQANAQYDQSGALTTILDNSSNVQEHSCGAISNGSKYALSYHYVDPPACHRKLRFFNGLGNVLGTSSPYSHDHSGVTKILFDPNNENFAYALYQERVSTPGSGAAQFRTYLKRFFYSSGNVAQSERIEVFNHNNSVDMAVTYNNGNLDILVAGVNNNGSVHVKVYRSIIPSLSINNTAYAGTIYVSAPGEAYSNSSLGQTWALDMDMKGSEFIVAHTIGNNTTPTMKINRYQYIPQTFNASITNSSYISGQHLHHLSGVRLRQSVGLRPNGDILYLSSNSIFNSDWGLYELDPSDPQNSPLLGSGTGRTNLVVSSNKMAFLAKQGFAANSVYSIDLYNEHSALEHNYTVDTELQNKITNLAVNGCQLLASAIRNDNEQNHEFFDCSDCVTGIANAEAEFTGQKFNSTVATPFGPTPYSHFCGMSKVNLDGSASTCEEGYYLSIAQWAPSSWTSLNSLYSGWVCTNCTVPHDIHIADYLPSGYVAPNGAYYLVTLAVGSPWHATHKLFRVQRCILDERKEVRKWAASGEANYLEGADFIGFKISPNPSSGPFRVQLDYPEDMEVLVEVSDLLGKKVYSESHLGKGELRLDLSTQSKGVYLISATSKSGKISKKIILK